VKLLKEKAKKLSPNINLGDRTWHTYDFRNRSNHYTRSIRSEPNRTVTNLACNYSVKIKSSL